jgi:alpha-tubulin suppressor-like RCC1 family protein
MGPNMAATNAAQLSVGNDHSCARTTTNTIGCWGVRTAGRLGDGLTTPASYTPVAVTGIADASDLDVGENHSCAVRTGGLVSCWGNGQQGELGQGTTANALTPVNVSGSGTTYVFTQVAASEDFSCAVTTGGNVYCWGRDHQTSMTSEVRGVIGVGTTVGPAAFTTPQQVQQGLMGVPLTDVVQVEAGVDHACARQTDGDIYCWGRNDYGQLGLGTTNLVRSRAFLVNGL